MNEESKPLLEKIRKSNTFQKLKGIKNIEIIIAIIVCVLAIGIYLVIDVSKKDTKNKSVESQSELESILENIEGVGKIKVLITYGNSGESVSGQEDSSILLEPDKGNSTYWDIKNSIGTYSKDSKIIGIIIVCEGANDPTVQVKLLNAITVATGVNANRIRIFPMK